MSDQVFYAAMQSLATKLLNKFGAPATVRQPTQTSAPDADGDLVPGQPVDTPGVAARTTDQVGLNALNIDADAYFVVKAPVEPTPDMLFIFGGQTWRVLKVKLSKPDGATLIISMLACELA